MLCGLQGGLSLSGPWVLRGLDDFCVSVQPRRSTRAQPSPRSWGHPESELCPVAQRENLHLTGMSPVPSAFPPRGGGRGRGAYVVLRTNTRLTAESTESGARPLPSSIGRLGNGVTQPRARRTH